jgi:hypothetical protein
MISLSAAYSLAVPLALGWNAALWIVVVVDSLLLTGLAYGAWRCLRSMLFAKTRAALRKGEPQ